MKRNTSNNVIRLAGGCITGFDKELVSQILRQHRKKPLKHKAKWVGPARNYKESPPEFGHRAQEHTDWKIYTGGKVVVSMLSRGMATHYSNFDECEFTFECIPTHITESAVRTWALREAARRERVEEAERRSARRTEIYYELVSETEEV